MHRSTSTAFSDSPFYFLRVLVFLAVVIAANATGAEPAATIPVLAWHGPPANETTIERYRELADAGFTHNFSNFGNVDAMAKALDVAQAAGIKQFVSIPELEKSPEDVAQRLKNHPALAGYYLRDEPSAGDFPRLAAWMKRIQAVDAEHPCYINLFPNYANAGQLGTATYREHLAQFVAQVPSPFISFDHYPVVGNSLRGEWYENLEEVRSAALAAKKPFWAFALAVAHNPYPIATIEHLRLQVFSDLAYGAQTIQYFTYWTPVSTVWNFHEAPITADGKRTAVYERVKEVNKEIRVLAPVFAGAKVLGVAHTGTLPRGTRAYEAAAPIASLKTEGTGAVVSMLENGGRRFVAVVNRDFKAPMALTVALDGSVPVSEFRKDGSSEFITGKEYAKSVGAGDVAVLAWETGR